TRRDHYNLFPIHGQRGGNLRADEPIADYDKTFIAFGQGTNPAIICERAVINDPVLAKRQAPRGPPGCQKQFIESPGLFAAIYDTFLINLDSLDPALWMKGDARFLGMTPDAFERLVFPKPFGKRWAIIRRVGFHTENC